MEMQVRLPKVLTVSGLAWLFDAMDVGLLSFVIAALKPEWQLTAGQMGMIGSISSLGMAVGAAYFGILADRIGRKDVLIFTLLLFSIGAGLSALVDSYLLFLILRFIVGAGLGGELPVASTLVAESVPTAQRGRMVVLLESFWAGGWLLSALIAYLVIPRWGWRVAVLGSALTALYALYLRYGLHEQPHVVGERLSFVARLKRVWAPEYRRATAMLWIVWFMVVFSYYGMFLWLPSVMVLEGFGIIKSFGYVLLMTIAQLPGYFVAAWLVEKWGRKRVLAVFLIGTAVAALAFGLAQNFAVLFSAGVGLSFFNLGAWGTLYAYTPEQYPEMIRATGSGLAAGFGRIGGILGPLMVGWLIAAQVSVVVIFGIFAVTILIGVIAVMVMGRETMGKTLA